MDTASAFAKGEQNRHRKQMVFDWEKAAKIIKEEQPQLVEAGLSGDWEWTGGEIYADGKTIEDSYTYLASTWATPQILVDGEYRDCFVMSDETPWNCETKWPEEAKAILNA